MLLTFVVDDDALYQFGIRRMLHHLGVETEICSFSNGQPALEYLTAHAGNVSKLPDIILLDINMPVMNGWQFLDSYIALRLNLVKKIAIYMITSSVGHDEIAKASSYHEISNYLIKPMSPDILRDVFKNL